LNSSSGSAKATVSILAACLFWAGSFIATKIALSSIPPLTVVSARLVVSAICFIIWMKILNVNFKKLYRYRWKLLLLSVFGTGLHYGIQTVGLQFTTASKGGIYAVTAPITITIIAAIFLNEKVSLKKFIGITTALAGVIIVIGIQKLLSFNLRGDLTGDILILISIFMWGIFTILGKSLTKKLGPLEITGIITIIGAIYTLPAGVYDFLKNPGLSLHSIEINSIFAVIFLGVTCSFLATLLYVYALSKMESQKVGVFLYTIPPMTNLIAFLVLGEKTGISMIAGTILVLSGVYLTERG